MSVGERTASDVLSSNRPKFCYSVSTTQRCHEDDATAVKNDRTLSAKAVGSIAARAQAWERSTSTAGYVTIGSIRYGVRFASGSPAKEVVPSRGAAPKQTDDSDCCCGVVQLAWPRADPPPPPSRIPLLNSPTQSQAINKRALSGKTSEERAAPVYRGTCEVSPLPKAPLSSFDVVRAVSNNGDMKATPPTPTSLNRRILVKPAFKFGSSASTDSETSRLLSSTGSRDDLSNESGSGSQIQNTLDKLNRFRFGGSSSSEDKSNHKKKRSGDKTERLRELTDKLRGRTPGSPDRKKPPICTSSPNPKLSSKQHSASSSLRNLFGSTTSLTSSHKEPSDEASAVPKRASSVSCVLPRDKAAAKPRKVPSDKADKVEKVCDAENAEKVDGVGAVGAGQDRFQCEDVLLRKAESRPIVGSYTQRTIAFRSASFSQVDYDLADGKYTRSHKGEGDRDRERSSLTFPRKRQQVDASTSVSPPPGRLLEETTSSTPSVDSAVGSDEGFALGSGCSIPLMADAHKQPGARSLTYPLTKKASRSDDMPFSSIDGNGLKSLQHSSSFTKDLPAVSEELSYLSEATADTGSLSSNDTVRERDCVRGEPFTNNAEQEGEAEPERHQNPSRELEDCPEDPEDPEDPEGAREQPAHALDPNIMTPLETLEREINDLITQHKNAAPKPEIFVTTWPKENDSKHGESPGDNSKVDRSRGKLKLNCSGDITTRDWNEEQLGKLGEDLDLFVNEEKSEPEPKTARSFQLTPEPEGSYDLPDTPHTGDEGKWYEESSNDWGSEPLSPEDNTKPVWSLGAERPKLTCQSSDEKDDEARPSPRRYQLSRNDSLSEGESDQGDRRPTTPRRERDRTASPSPLFCPMFDMSDGEGRVADKRSVHAPRRYSKRPLRGPYGQMLEAEMKKPETTRLLSKKQLNEDLKFLENYISPLPEGSPVSPDPDATRPSSESRLSGPRQRPATARSLDDSQLRASYGSAGSPRTSPKRKVSANIPFSAPSPSSQKEGLMVHHQRTTSSPSQLEGFSSEPSSSPSPSPVPRRTEATQELLAQLLKGSSERRFLSDEPSLLASSFQCSKVRTLSVDI